MTLKVLPTRIEILDEEMKTVMATVTLVDGYVVKIELPSVVGWNDWLNITDAARKAMHMMEMHKFEEGSVPHGY